MADMETILKGRGESGDDRYGNNFERTRSKTWNHFGWARKLKMGKILGIGGWVSKIACEKSSAKRLKHFRNGCFHQRLKNFASSDLTCGPYCER
jgi:hypothetical protein